jgi:hypothetical protein
MYYISKEQIEEVIEVLNTHIGHYTEDIESESAIAMLQGLLAQPEQEPVTRLSTCKSPLLAPAETVARTYEEHLIQQAKNDKFWDENATPIATRPAPITQPECEPVCYEYQARSGLWFPFIDQRHHDNTVNDGTYPIRPLYTHPAPFTPITADDVHGDVVVNLWRVGVLTSTGTQGKDIVAKVVNAWGAKQ